MNPRLSIGTSYKHGGFIASLIFAPLLALVGGLNLTIGNAELAPYFLSAGGIAGLLTGVLALRIARGRRWLTPSDEGFVIEDRRGRFEFSDDHITDLGTWSKVRYSNGRAKSIERRGTMTLLAGEFRGNLDFRYVFPLAKPDPLEEFLDRNLHRLTKLASENLKANGELQGEQWTLDAKQLHFEEKRQSRTVMLAEIAAVDLVERKICIWLNDEELPAVRIPGDSQNAFVLLRLLQEEVKKRPARDDDDGESLGRIIFERNRSIKKAGYVVLGVVCGGLLLLSIASVVAGLVEKGMPAAAFIVASVLGALSGLIFLVTWLNRTNIFRCHAYGVSRITTIKGQRTMRYEDVRVFTYAAVSMYVNGAYSGTTVTMTFEPRSGPKDSLKYSITYKNADPELDNLRDHVSRVMAQHMRKRLAEGKVVLWTDRVRFTPEGLEITGKSGIFRKGEDRFVPYDEILDIRLDKGSFFLFQHGEKKSVYEAVVNTPNFFPGLALLVAIRFPPQPPRTAINDGDDDPRRES